MQLSRGSVKKCRRATGAHVAVEQKSAPFFKTGKEMRERLNRTAAS